MRSAATLLCFFAGMLPAHAQTPGSAWEADIKAFEALDAVAFPAPDAFLFIGSSSIRRWTTLAQDFPHVAVINRGFGGSQLDDVTAFVDRIVVPYRPKMILLYCGDNDIVAGKSPSVVFAEFQAFVAQVRRSLPHTPIAYLAMKPAPGTWATYGARIREGNQLIRDTIAGTPGLSYIDVVTPMLNAEGQPRLELFASDHEHLNPAGYALWVSLVKPVIESASK